MGHGRAMINIEDEEQQLNIYEKIISKNLSVRNTEKIIQSLKKGIITNKVDKLTISSSIKKEILKVEKKLGTKIKVSINKNENGKIIIPFSSKKDFFRINKIINE